MAKVKMDAEPQYVRRGGRLVRVDAAADGVPKKPLPPNRRPYPEASLEWPERPRHVFKITMTRGTDTPEVTEHRHLFTVGIGFGTAGERKRALWVTRSLRGWRRVF